MRAKPCGRPKISTTLARGSLSTPPMMLDMTFQHVSRMTTEIADAGRTLVYAINECFLKSLVT